MLALISPAKKMDFESEWSVTQYTQPRFLKQSQILVDILKDYSVIQLQSLMKLSDKLAKLNADRYRSYKAKPTTNNARSAVSAFRGDTYIGLDADTLSSKDLVYAQDHLGILSGLYGLLQPLDLIQPYRLEMGTKLANPQGETLYDFWGDSLVQACNTQLRGHKDKTVICLASNEYIKAIAQEKLNHAFIVCHFKEMRDGQPKTIGLFAKRARGMMARFMLQQRIEAPEGLKAFRQDGYAFKSSLSDESNYVFVRKQV